MSQKVAILIPTKNRIDFLIRTIQYYASINSPHPLFIGDASNQSVEEKVLEAAKDKIEVHYFHWVDLSDRRTMIKLAEKASKIYHFNYCAYQGDDDFFIAESLSKCADFLTKNPSYTTSQGYAFRFELNQDAPYGDLKDIGIYWDSNELKGEAAIERLEEISNNYWVPIFSVHRIIEYIDSMSNGIDTVVDRNFGEYVNSLTIALNGKSKFVDCLYLARNIHSGINHGSSLEWISGKDWNLSYYETINSLSEVLSKNDNLNETESNIAAKLAIDNLLVIFKHPDISTYNFIKKKYSSYISKRGFIYLLSKFFRLIKKMLFSHPSSNFSVQQLQSPRSKYYSQVSLILNACKKD